MNETSTFGDKINNIKDERNEINDEHIEAKRTKLSDSLDDSKEHTQEPEIFYDFNGFLDEEIAQMKSAMFGSTVVCRSLFYDQPKPLNINENKFSKLSQILTDNVTESRPVPHESSVSNTEPSPIEVSDTELMSICDIFEDKSNDFAETSYCENAADCEQIPDQIIEDPPVFVNAIASEIYNDFNEVQNECRNNYNRKLFPNYIFKRRIRRTYTNKTRIKRWQQPDDEILESATKCADQIIKNCNFSLNTSNHIDVVLSQPVSENLLTLTTFFLPKTASSEADYHYNKSIKYLEETKISIDLQYSINYCHSLSYGILCNYEDLKNSRLEVESLPVTLNKNVISPNICKLDNVRAQHLRSTGSPKVYKPNLMNQKSDSWTAVSAVQQINKDANQNKINQTYLTRSTHKLSNVVDQATRNKCNISPIASPSSPALNQRVLKPVNRSRLSLPSTSKQLHENTNQELANAAFKVPSPMPSPTAFVGFQTASKKKIHISKEAMKKAASLLKCAETEE